VDVAGRGLGRGRSPLPKCKNISFGVKIFLYLSPPKRPNPFFLNKPLKKPSLDSYNIGSITLVHLDVVDFGGIAFRVLVSALIYYPTLAPGG